MNMDNSERENLSSLGDSQLEVVLFFLLPKKESD